MLKLQTKTQNPLMRPRSTQPQRVLQFGQHVYQGNWDPENTKLRGSITLFGWPLFILFGFSCIVYVEKQQFYSFDQIQTSQGQRNSDTSPYGECSLLDPTNYPRITPQQCDQILQFLNVLGFKIT